MVASPLAPASTYVALFRDYIAGNLACVLADVKQRTILDSEGRTQVLYSLSYALQWEATWESACELLLAVASPMEQAGLRDEWVPYLHKGIAVSRTLSLPRVEGQLRYYLGILYQLQFDLHRARTEFEKSLAYFEQEADPLWQARTLNRLAYGARQLRQFDQACAWVQTVQQLASGYPEEIAYSYLVLGTIAFDEQAWEAAHQAFEQSLTLWQQTGNRRMIAWGYTNLGTPLWALKRYDDATYCYEQAIAIFEAVHDPVHQATAQTNLGSILLEQGQPFAALEQFAQAEPVFTSLQDRLRLGALANNQGKAYHALGEWSRARDAYHTAMAYWQALAKVDSLVNTMDGMARVCVAQHDPVGARHWIVAALEALPALEGTSKYEYLHAKLQSHLAEVERRFE